MVRESTLPQREKQLFHKLVKSYEQKQFKQGLKHAKPSFSLIDFWADQSETSIPGDWENPRIDP